jgi:hypothetical protein
MSDARRPGDRDAAARLEEFLARLYCDARALRQFLRSPRQQALRAGLSAAHCAALERMNFDDLELAAHSFARKRARKPRPALLHRLLGALSRLRRAWTRAATLQLAARARQRR